MISIYFLAEMMFHLSQTMTSELGKMSEQDQ